MASPSPPNNSPPPCEKGVFSFASNYGEWPDSKKKRRFDAFRQQRLLLNSELEGIPYHITQAAAARFIKQLLGMKTHGQCPRRQIVETLSKWPKGRRTLDDIDRLPPSSRTGYLVGYRHDWQ